MPNDGPEPVILELVDIPSGEPETGQSTSPVSKWRALSPIITIALKKCASYTWVRHGLCTEMRLEQRVGEDVLLQIGRH